MCFLVDFCRAPGVFPSLSQELFHLCQFPVWVSAGSEGFGQCQLEVADEEVSRQRQMTEQSLPRELSQPVGSRMWEKRPRSL